jgi:hypothetical protein
LPKADTFSPMQGQHDWMSGPRFWAKTTPGSSMISVDEFDGY